MSVDSMQYLLASAVFCVVGTFLFCVQAETLGVIILYKVYAVSQRVSIDLMGHQEVGMTSSSFEPSVVGEEFFQAESHVWDLWTLILTATYLYLLHSFLVHSIVRKHVQ